jgi:hypothetical protein
MSIIGSDPLAFLTAQGGVVGTPLTEGGAGGADNLDQKQRSAVVGEPIPIVFCRRTGGAGGVLISPPATEARFEDDASSNITASYHLVLSEGVIDSIQVRDVFQRSCRVGSFTQTYDRRAGTFVAGNFIDNTPNLEAPTYCGTSGAYDGLSTMAFSVTIPAGFDQWNRQVHCFIRGGIYVTRLLDSVTGPSNNVADLLLYLLRNSSRVPEAQIDTANLLAAATFINANGFWFNGVVSESTNLRDWISNTLKYFLLRQARIGGKEALKPLVPTNNDGTIKTTAVTWVFTFTEQHIIPDSFEITYSPLADRKPFCATMLWRQQDDLGIPVMRTTEVRYTGTAVDGPYEQHDLSGFCSTESHAVKVGAYIISKRRHVTHRLQLGVKPDAYNPTLAAGDLVRVRLERIASTGADSVHDYLYEVDRIGKSITGEVQLDLTHFPIDPARSSLVALEVNDATGSGLLLPTGLSGVTCDVNSSSDTSVPAESFTDGSFPDYGSEVDNRDYSCDGIAAIQFSFEPSGTSQTWYNARNDGAFIDANGKTGYLWRYYFPVGSNTQVFQGTAPGDVRSVRNTGCGGDGNGGQLDGNSLDGFAGGGVDPTGGNPEDGLDSMEDGATPLGPFITAPSPGGPSGVPPEGVCPGAVITRTIGNLDEEGNVTQSVSQVVADYSFPFTPPEALGGDDYNNKYVGFSVRCPNGEEQVIDPIIEPPVEPTAFTYWRVVLSNGTIYGWQDTNYSEGYFENSGPGVNPQSGPWIAPTQLFNAIPNQGVTGFLGAVRYRIIATSAIQGGFVGYTGAVSDTLPPFECDPTAEFEFSNNQVDIIGPWGGR